MISHPLSFPILSTDRLTLRQLSVDDQNAIYALRSDPNINKYLNRQPCPSIEVASDFITKINDNIAKGDTYYWAITLTDTNALIGTICVFDLSGEKSSCELGYELMTHYQGQGIMREAAQSVIDFVFNTVKLNNILAYTHHENQHSTNLLLKLNFVKTDETVADSPDLQVFTLQSTL